MIKQNLTQSQLINNFKVEKVEDIPELRSQAAILTHEKTGARVLHLFNEDPNNLFSIAFRTPVYDNTGVPHILEHSVLCGSRKFPVKDPFQELLKGSLQTFLNAMTYPDKTVYPVSSQVETDFFNLVDVYCDAVLHPLLTKNTLAQEGWHFDIEDPYGPVNIKGIVYNEMKGVFSDFSSHVARKTMSELFPDTTYFYESGGEPEDITNLTYEHFKDFHAKYYHPSNSFIFLYGNIPTERTLQFLEEKYLCDYERLEVDSKIKLQDMWKKSRTMEIEAPAPEKDDGTATIAVNWIFGTTTDPINMLLGRVFSRYLIGTESSPLKRALVDSGLGEDLDDISGFDTDLIQGIFAVGVRKCKPEHAERIKTLIMDTLQKEIDKGLDEDLLEGAIRRLEFSLREISGSGHYPYNVQLAERCYRSWLYDGDPLIHLKFEKGLKFIKEKKEEGTAFFAEKMQELLLNNPHHLLSTIKASSEMGKRLEKQTQEQARRLSKDFGQKEKRRHHRLTLKLLEEQKTPPSAENKAKLPKLSKSDLPLKGKEVPTNKILLSNVPLYAHPLFTAGIVYLDVGFDCGTVPYPLLPWLPLYSELLTKCGAKGLTYEEMSRRISLSTGGLSSSLLCETRVGTASDLLFKCFFHVKALPERVGETLEILSDLFLAPDLSNTKQIKDLLFEMRNDLNASIIHAGHSFAMIHASSGLSKSRYVDETLGGITQLRFLDSLIRENNMEKAVDTLKSLHHCLINKKTSLLSMTADRPDEFTKPLESFLSGLPAKDLPPSDIPFSINSQGLAHGIEISSSVNFVAKAWRLDPVNPPDMGRFFLLSKNLSTGYLWDKVRVEGGAYGGMSRAGSSHPVFVCASYRDPNLYRTLTCFEEGLKETAAGLDTEKVNQGIIGALGAIDKPKSPRSQGFHETTALLNGRTREYRQELRESVLSTTPEFLKEAAQKLLSTGDTCITVLGSSTALDIAEKEGMEINREALVK